MKSLATILKKNSKLKYCIYIFLLAFAFRVFIISFFNTGSIAIDGTGYHRIACNLADGKGYSLHVGEKYFFREPGYPVFLALSFEISKMLGNKPEYITVDKDYNIINKAPEVTIAKYMQAIVDSLACVIFFLLIAGILKQKYALIIAIIFCLYFPYAYSVTNILRETLQSFLGLAMTYTLMLYFNSDKNKYLVLTGIVWGLLNLTFQSSLIFGVSLPIFIWIHKKSFLNAIKPSAIIITVMFLTTSPWLLRTYHSYPDLRILKSFGTSLTPEHRSYFETVIAANYYGLITDQQKLSIQGKDWLALSEADKFRLSWDGTIKHKQDSLNLLFHENIISKRKIINLATNLKNCMPQTFAGPIINEKPFLAVLLILPLLLLCLFAVLGAFIFLKRFFTINIVFITYISIFMLIASEKRRMLPIQPFILLYGILGIIYCYHKFLKRHDNIHINEIIFTSQS